MAVVIDRSEVARFVRAAVSQGQNVVDLVSLADPAKPGAIITPAEILIAPEDLVAQAAPRAATTT